MKTQINSLVTREQLAKVIFSENPKFMEVEVKGVKLKLKKFEDTRFSCKLSDDDFFKITGDTKTDTFKEFRRSFCIDFSLSVAIYCESRAHNGYVWELETYIQLSDTLVTIL